MEGHYTYEHAFSYDMDGYHFEVSETGTMDFYADGTALDSARQVYVVTSAQLGSSPHEGMSMKSSGLLPKDGGVSDTIVFNYISPSRWRLEGDTLFFAGTKEGFRMEMVEGRGVPPCTPSNVPLCTLAVELAQKIADTYRGSIDYEYKFHLDTLTAEKLQWSFTYRDGHSDTWQFYRK